MAKHDRSQISSILIFTFTSFGSKDFNINLISLTSYIPSGYVYPIVVVIIIFLSSVSYFSLYVNCNEKPRLQDRYIQQFSSLHLSHFYESQK